MNHIHCVWQFRHAVSKCQQWSTPEGRQLTATIALSRTQWEHLLNQETKLLQICLLVHLVSKFKYQNSSLIIWKMGWLVFYGLSTLVGYLMPNSVYIYIYIYIYIYMVHSISFQTFFYKHLKLFKIGVDSWKFSMLLLYILWDDWPIFMISGSNKQLQQQLEYTLLKPDYHSWGISKMQSRREDTLKEHYAIKFCFKLGKNAAETYGMLQSAFGPSCMNWALVFEWHKRFKEGRESVRDDERFGRSKEVNTPQLIGQTVRVRVTMLRF